MEGKWVCVCSKPLVLHKANRLDCIRVSRLCSKDNTRSVALRGAVQFRVEHLKERRNIMITIELPTNVREAICEGITESSLLLLGISTVVDYATLSIREREKGNVDYYMER